MGVSKNSGFSPKMDGENKGKTLLKFMIWRVKTLFLECHPYDGWTRDPPPSWQGVSEQTKRREAHSIRFHETILSFGEPGSLLGCPRKLYSKRLVSGL